MWTPMNYDKMNTLCKQIPVKKQKAPFCFLLATIPPRIITIWISNDMSKVKLCCIGLLFLWASFTLLIRVIVHSFLLLLYHVFPDMMQWGGHFIFFQKIHNLSVIMSKHQQTQTERCSMECVTCTLQTFMVMKKRNYWETVTVWSD